MLAVLLPSVAFAHSLPVVVGHMHGMDNAQVLGQSMNYTVAMHRHFHDNVPKNETILNNSQSHNSLTAR